MLSKRLSYFAVILIIGALSPWVFAQDAAGGCRAWFTDPSEAIIGRDANTDITWRCDTSNMTFPTLTGTKTGIPKNTPIAIEFPAAFTTLKGDNLKCRYSVNSVGVKSGTAFNKVDLLPASGAETAIITLTHDKDIEVKPGDALRFWCDNLSTPATAGEIGGSTYIIGSEAEIGQGVITWPHVYSNEKELPQHFTIITLTGTLPALQATTTTTVPRADGTDETPKRPEIDMDKLDSLKSSIQGVLGSGISLSHYQTAFDPATNTLVTMHRIVDGKNTYDPDLIDDHIKTDDIQKVIMENVGLVYPELTDVTITAEEVTLANCDNLASDPEAKGKGSTTSTKYCAVDNEACAPCKTKSVCTDDTQCEYSRCDNGTCIKLNSASMLSMAAAFAAIMLAVFGVAF